MRNPLADEDAAFRLVLGTIAYFVPIVLAAWVAAWLGLIVFVVATATVVVLLRRSRGTSASEAAVDQARVADTLRILVVANEGLAGPRLVEELRRATAGVVADVLVACPVGALAGDDTDGGEGDRAGRSEAGERLRCALERLSAVGVNARGELVDGDPTAALDELLRRYEPARVVISTIGGRSSAGVEDALVAAARESGSGQVVRVVESGFPG